MADPMDRHDEHDLARLVAFVDGELDPIGVAATAEQLATCAGCASLADDLRLLAVADRLLPTPARPRDLRLTTADAARITGLVAEPATSPTRLASEMNHDRTVPAAHATHDAALVAASVDDSLTIGQRRTVDTWLAACAPCAELRADLLAIAEAHRTLPTPARPRDFRLNERHASRLRMGRWRDLLAWIGGSHDGLTRPLAAGLTTLGLVGVLITGAPAMMSGMGSTAGAAPATISLESGKVGVEELDPGDSTVFNGSGDDPSDAAALPPGSSAPSDLAAPAGGSEGAEPNAVSNATESSRLQVSASQGADQFGTTEAGPTENLREVASDPSPPVGLIASLVALVAGLAIFVTRRVTRPLRGG